MPTESWLRLAASFRDAAEGAGGPYTATVTLPDAKRLNIRRACDQWVGHVRRQSRGIRAADPPEPKKFGAIKGMVVQGPDERPRKKLTVRLLDPKGVELKVKVTDDKGEIAFEELLPGKYFVTSGAKRSNDGLQRSDSGNRQD